MLTEEGQYLYDSFPNYQLEVCDKSDKDAVDYILESPSHLGLIARPEHYHGRQTQFSPIKTYAPAGNPDIAVH